MRAVCSAILQRNEQPNLTNALIPHSRAGKLHYQSFLLTAPVQQTCYKVNLGVLEQKTLTQQSLQLSAAPAQPSLADSGRQRTVVATLHQVFVVVRHADLDFILSSCELHADGWFVPCSVEQTIAGINASRTRIQAHLLSHI